MSEGSSTAVKVVKTEKICPKCRELKPSTEFHSRMEKNIKVLRTYCKPCDRKRKKDIYWRDPEKQRRRSKRLSLRYGRRNTVEQDIKHNKIRRTQRLSIRVDRANLLIDLCVKEYEITNREYIMGRFLLGKYEECASMAVWVVRKFTLFSRDAVADIFNCATSDVNERIKMCLKENSWERGDIIFRMRYENVKKGYHKFKATHHSQVKLLPFESFSKAQLEDRTNIPYIAPKEPPTKGITTDQLIEVVCWYYAVSWDKFLNDTKSRGNVVKARQVVMYLLNKYMGTDVPTIAGLFGKEHTTIIHGIKHGHDLIQANRGSLYYELHRRLAREESPCEDTQENTRTGHTL